VTTFLLIRHAACAQMSERLYGRTVAAPLSSDGRQQARRLGQSLARERLTQVRASPRERTRDTAAVIAARHRLEVHVDPALDEIDFGEWSGITFRELERDARWRAWNEDREKRAPPGGESIHEVQQRVIGLLHALGRAHPGECIALVSHAEVIRSALLAIRGWSPNRWREIELEPASVTTLHAEGTPLRLSAVVPATRARSAP
jgi:broad specificity phosphatase PhoE